MSKDRNLHSDHVPPAVYQQLTHCSISCRTLVSQLIQHERIETTVQKAKEVRRLADRVVTWGKEGTLAARREAAAVIRGKHNVSKLFSELAERYKERDGGYTRIFRTRRRPNDGAQMAFIEYVDREGELRPARPPRNSMLPKAAQLIADEQSS